MQVPCYWLTWLVCVYVPQADMPWAVLMVHDLFWLKRTAENSGWCFSSCIANLDAVNKLEIRALFITQPILLLWNTDTLHQLLLWNTDTSVVTMEHWVVTMEHWHISCYYGTLSCYYGTLTHQLLLWNTDTSVTVTSWHIIIIECACTNH